METDDWKYVTDKEDWKNQEHFVLLDESYERILSRLNSGEKNVKSFVGRCPHKKREDCVCAFALNCLNEDGKMVRTVNGHIKPVISESVAKAIGISIIVEEYR
jgi:hypothetical protein